MARSKCVLPTPVDPQNTTGEACCRPRAVNSAARYAYSLLGPTTNRHNVAEPRPPSISSWTTCVLPMACSLEAAAQQWDFKFTLSTLPFACFLASKLSRPAFAEEVNA